MVEVVEVMGELVEGVEEVVGAMGRVVEDVEEAIYKLWETEGLEKLDKYSPEDVDIISFIDSFILSLYCSSMFSSKTLFASFFNSISSIIVSSLVFLIS